MIPEKVNVSDPRRDVVKLRGVGGEPLRVPEVQGQEVSPQIHILCFCTPFLTLFFQQFHGKDMHKAAPTADIIMESWNGLGWKGPLKIIYLTVLLGTGTKLICKSFFTDYSRAIIL